MNKRRSFIATTTAVAAASLAAMAAPAVAVQPIEGAWYFEGGQVLVEPIGPNAFKGTVIQPTRFSECTHPVGQRMWEIVGSGAGYTGTHVYFRSDSAAECSWNPGGLSVWSVSEQATRFLLGFCTAPPGLGSPGPGNPETTCRTLDRAKAPPDRRRACRAAGALCVNGPADLRTIGCLRRIRMQHRFRISLTRRGSGHARVTQAFFTLDGKAAGRDRRRPFQTGLNGETLVAGAHVLKTTITLRARSGRRLQRTVTYKFNACERG